MQESERKKKKGGTGRGGDGRESNIGEGRREKTKGRQKKGIKKREVPGGLKWTELEGRERVSRRGNSKGEGRVE